MKITLILGEFNLYYLNNTKKIFHWQLDVVKGKAWINIDYQHNYFVTEVSS